MATVTEVRDKLVRLAGSLGLIITSTFRDTEKDAVELQQDQWDIGIRADGGEIGQYSSFTKSIKKRKGQETKFVNLQDTGALIKSIKFTNITEEFAEIDATDWKRNKVTSRYGEDIFGLTAQFTQEYSQDRWFKSFTNKIRTALWQK